MSDTKPCINCGDPTIHRHDQIDVPECNDCRPLRMEYNCFCRKCGVNTTRINNDSLLFECVRCFPPPHNPHRQAKSEEIRTHTGASRVRI